MSDPAYAATRWLGYLAGFAVVGAAVLRIWLLPRIADAPADQIAAVSRRAVRAGRLASITAAITLLLKLYFQSRSMIEPEEPLSFDIVQLVVASSWGKGWLAQGMAALAVLIGWRAMANPARNRWASRLVALGALGLILAMPLTGHATGLPAAGRLGYPLTVLHVGGGALWLGTLGVILVTAIGPADPAFPLGRLVRSYSAIALPAGLVTMGCGLAVAWRYVGGFGALLSTVYGNVLLVKLAVLGAIAGAGVYNWRVVLPRLEIGQVTPLSRSAKLETIAGIILLAVTAYLVSLPAPSDLAP